jgi:hypothetical protein
MNKIDDGESAFPRPDWNGSWAGSYVFKGMSLRDWFAGQALPAVIAATAAGQHRPVPNTGDKAGLDAAIARDAYALADAMIEARKVKP